MRKITLFLILTLFIAGSAFAYDGRSYSNDIVWGDGFFSNNFEIDIDDGTVIIISHRHGSDVVEITEDYELYINDRHIKTNSDQKQLLGEFHSKTLVMVEEAKEIGLEGAEIGIKGAKIGMKAIGGVFKLFLSEYDAEDLEEELEWEAEQLEAEAEKLEEQAEELEDLAEDLEDLADELVLNIPELDDLDW